MKFFATAARGTEEVCAAELRALGAARVEATGGGVAFEGPEDLGWRACLWLRTAMRVLVPLAEFPAQGPEALYEGARALDWSAWLTPRHTFAVECTLRDSEITHSHYAALKIKDAIADALRARHGVRPDVDAKDPDVRVVARLAQDRCAISLDLAGEPLHRRGYRVEETVAPLKETLAAAMVLLSGWDRAAPLCDPMCGSGTIAIEAALLAMDRAPGLGRSFGFERWPSFGERRRVEELRAEARARALARPPGPVLASDWHADAVRAATLNVAAAGLAHAIRPERRDARAIEPLSPPGFVITNPPYGERLGERKSLQLRGLYRGLGERWSGFFGHTIVVLSGHRDFERELGMEPAARRTLWNGPIRCELLTYRIGAAMRSARPHSAAAQ